MSLRTGVLSVDVSIQITLNMRVLELNLQNLNGRDEVDFLQTVISVVFCITYILPMIGMFLLLIYYTIADYNNGHEIRLRDVSIYIFMSVCPIINCYGLIEILKE